MLCVSPFFLATDIGFIAYWLLTAMSLIPPDYQTMPSTIQTGVEVR
jgi:Family of unknown function (DUF5360)